MKSKYVFIRNWPDIQAGDFIYSVWVGSSRREQAKYLLVREFCRDCSLYFKLNAIEVVSEIEKAKARFRRDGNVNANPFRSASVTISELYRMIVDNSFDAFEANQTENRSSLWWNFHRDLQFIQSQNINDVVHHASPSGSKNLSIRKRVHKHEMDITSLT